MHWEMLVRLCALSKWRRKLSPWTSVQPPQVLFATCSIQMRFTIVPCTVNDDVPGLMDSRGISGAFEGCHTLAGDDWAPPGNLIETCLRAKR
jgi:hypothetical protein